MATYERHKLTATITGIHHYEINSIANAGKKNSIFINSITYDDGNYTISFSLNNLAEDVKRVLINNEGEFEVQIGRMNRDRIPYYSSSHRGDGNGKNRRSVKICPSHGFVRSKSFEYTMNNDLINGTSTYSMTVSELEMIGFQNWQVATCRYKSMTDAKMWKYITFRVRLRLRIPDTPNHRADYAGPYRLNSDEIITYCTFE